jgi:hypothetical protein
MTFKVFRIKTDTDNKNITDLEHILNEFEVDLDTKDMQINNHMLTTSPKSIGDNILLIAHYRPKPAEEIIGTESL